MKANKLNSQRRQHGFTLIEVLVAILVFAIGLLALAGLQLQTLRYAHSAGLRTIATTQASSLADMVRANKAGNYKELGEAEEGESAASCFAAAGCTPQEMARLDVSLWNESNAAVLPGGIGTICIDSTPNDGTSAAPACDNEAGAPYVIKIWWSDDRSANADLNTTRFVTSFQP